MSNQSKTRYIPIIIAVSIVTGIFIGNFYASRFAEHTPGLGSTHPSNNKLNGLLRIINDQYVDTVNIADLVEEAMPQILGELDPHSSYIPAKDLQAVNDDLRGSFSGIGVQFTIQQDTIHISDVISGGPSEKVGIMPGDRIVEIDDSAFVGKIVTNNESMKRLKGPKGSEVKLGIFRPGEKEILYFTIIRGDIPNKSIKASYMMDEKFGYINIEKFGETTYPEMLIALAQLHQQNCEGLIIDLRGNTGGYMGAAIQMVNEFLPKGKLIVYTEGRQSPRENYPSNGTGSSQQLPLIVLLDEGSASASEIFAGAIQDNDRGTIIGRRSFGKGLVQQPIEFNDGSAIRLTIARYYTPSGRCIQKPYEKGKKDEYRDDIDQRYKHGELTCLDSIHLDSTKVYKTLVKGRTVYGGGGIMPDVFVPFDTAQYTDTYRKISRANLIVNESLRYTNEQRKKLAKSYPTFEDFYKQYSVPESLLNTILKKAAEKEIRPKDEADKKATLDQLAFTLKALVAYDLWDRNEYLRIINERDDIVQRALQIITSEDYDTYLQ